MLKKELSIDVFVNKVQEFVVVVSLVEFDDVGVVTLTEYSHFLQDFLLFANRIGMRNTSKIVHTVGRLSISIRVYFLYQSVE